MKLAERVLNLFEAVNMNAVLDQLFNNEEVTAGDLVDIAKVPKDKAQKIIDAWWNMDAMDRSNMTDPEAKKWIKGLLK